MKPRLALEIGGTKFQAAVGETNGRIITSGRCRVPDGPVPRQIAALTDLARQVAANTELGSVGIGFGGPVDNQRGRVILSHHVEGWSDFPLRDWAQDAFGVPCVVENDSNAGALAEARLGAGAGARVVFYTNVGSGIGGGLVIDGQLYNGRYGAAEIGHTYLWDRSSGRYVITEQLCSGWSINRIARGRCLTGKMPRVLELAGGNVEAITAEHVGRAAQEGDSAALALIEEVTANFSVALCNVISLLNPDRIVIGGGVSLMGAVFFAPLRTAVATNAFQPYADNYRIVPAAFGEEVVLVGALLI